MKIITNVPEKPVIAYWATSKTHSPYIIVVPKETDDNDSSEFASTLLQRNLAAEGFQTVSSNHGRLVTATKATMSLWKGLYSKTPQVIQHNFNFEEKQLAGARREHNSHGFFATAQRSEGHLLDSVILIGTADSIQEAKDALSSYLVLMGYMLYQGNTGNTVIAMYGENRVMNTQVLQYTFKPATILVG